MDPINAVQFAALSRLFDVTGRAPVDRSVASSEIRKEHPAVLDSLLAMGLVEVRPMMLECGPRRRKIQVAVPRCLCRQQGAERMTTKNRISLGHLLQYANEASSGLREISIYDHGTLAHGFPGDLEKVLAAIDTYRGDALMNAVDSVIELAAECNWGKRPPANGRAGDPEVERGRAVWAKVIKILELKGWPAVSIGEAVEVARDMSDDGEFADAYGEERRVLCHGCPDEKVPGTEKDPRGFPGLLCRNCFEGARRDVATGHAELGPDASEEAKAKAAEVEREYAASKLSDPLVAGIAAVLQKGGAQ